MAPGALSGSKRWPQPLIISWGRAQGKGGRPYVCARVEGSACEPGASPPHFLSTSIPQLSVIQEAPQWVSLLPSTSPDVACYSADLSLIYLGKKNLSWPPNQITQGKKGVERNQGT